VSQKLLRGFTAIELIAVLCVLLILAGIVIAVFVSAKDSAPGRPGA
jgi:prepilin-type N-terminal cleavage/methylation domain-containing protein